MDRTRVGEVGRRGEERKGVGRIDGRGGGEGGVQKKETLYIF